MKQFKQLFTAVFSMILLCGSVTAQDITDWIQTEAKILKIEKMRNRRTVNEKATVSYKIQGDDKTYKSTVILDRLPIIGSMKSAGDVITISYRKSKPYILQTNTNAFMSKYGMYVLMIAGLGILMFNIRKIRKKALQQKSSLNQ